MLQVKIVKLILSVAFVLLSEVASAQAESVVSASSSLMQVAIALFFIIGLIFSSAWFMRRFNVRGWQNHQCMKILSVMPVGNKEKIALVEVEGEKLLIGVTSHSINLLNKFESSSITESTASNEELAVDDREAQINSGSQEPSKRETDFSHYLKAVLNGNRKTNN
ncbi:MAG: flagellar protein FliO/FliZ [Flavobacteriales bacterium]|jgi:flagellar protein FliO/FliZ